MRVWIVGSGTLRPDPLRGPPAHWIEGAGVRVLLDCGSGTLRTLARLGRPWQEVTHLVLSHLHTDHVGELAPLLFALKHAVAPPRARPLHLLGPVGLRDHLDCLSGAHGSYILEPGFPLEVRELKPGDTWEEARVGFRLLTRGALHTQGSLVIRMELPRGTLGYTGDTGPDPELGAFFRGSRLLIAECSHPDSSGSDRHLTPTELADLATTAAPELLVTVHSYPPLEPREIPDLLAKAGYRGNVRAGEDGLVVELSDGKMAVGGPTWEG